MEISEELLRTKRCVHDKAGASACYIKKEFTALEGGSRDFRGTAYWVCQDPVNMIRYKAIALKRRQAVGLRLAASHDVAGSEAGVSALSLKRDNQYALFKFLNKR